MAAPGAAAGGVGAGTGAVAAAGKRWLLHPWLTAERVGTDVLDHHSWELGGEERHSRVAPWQTPQPPAVQSDNARVKNHPGVRSEVARIDPLHTLHVGKLQPTSTACLDSAMHIAKDVGTVCRPLCTLLWLVILGLVMHLPAGLKAHLQATLHSVAYASACSATACNGCVQRPPAPVQDTARVHLSPLGVGGGVQK